ncbi:serine/threonine-protein kinase [Kitasatospora sp. NPDC088134]|uniref:serine/threonine-protein kinase n=1 Tax=Kitasatospora sp. NPDC088134 TaxID=3364071 RepID=UPI0037FBE811
MLSLGVEETATGLDPGLVVVLPVVLLLALLARLLTLPLLRRSQQAARSRALATATGSAPAGVGPVQAEFVVAVLLGAGLEAVLLAVPNDGFELLRGPLAFADLHGVSVAYGLARDSAQLWQWGLGGLLVAAWVLLAHLARHALLTAGMPAAVIADAAVRRWNLARLGLFAVLGVLALPLGVLLAGLVFQACALALAHRHPASAGATAAPRFGAAPVPVPTAHPLPVAPPTALATAYAPPPPASTPPPAPAAPPVHLPAQVRHHPLHGHEPRSIGGYRLLGRIGAGGMGTVYLASREGAATQVALKTINPDLLGDPDLLRRFQRESEVLAMVPGAYTARVLDTGVDAGRPFLAMELLDGRPLDAHLREHGPLRSAEALRALALALAVALSGVHRLGLVHRDLKPANIMLTTAGPRLLDFGIAALLDGTRLTMTGAGPGTLTYMAPEQFGDERVGTAADIWAWACCVVCAAHGASPFAATSTGGVIRRIVDIGPEPAALAAVRALDPALAAVVTRALAPDPAARPADGTALSALLTAERPEDVRAEITRGWSTLRL